MSFASISLKGHHIRLVPFEDHYATHLATTGSPQMMYYTYGPTEWTPYGIRTYILQRFTGLPNHVPLVIIKQETNEVIGFAAFTNIRRDDNRLEIGPIWIAEAHQGSLAFTETMYIMLKHAFEAEESRRVEFRCASSNIRFKMALLKIGATIEGTIRKDALRTDKSVRDTLLFGMIDTDWPNVRETLQLRLYPEKYPPLAEVGHISIRPSRAEDLPSIIEVENSAFGQGYSFSTIRQYYDLFDNLLYVAETKDARIVGYVLGGITTRDRQIGWVLSIGVRRDYQRKGIGKQLMNTIHMQLHACGCREILLTVHPAKNQVIHLYEKMGYTKQQITPEYFGPNSPRYVMQRKLHNKS